MHPPAYIPATLAAVTLALAALGAAAQPSQVPAAGIAPPQPPAGPGEAMLARAAAEKGAVVTPSGLVYAELRAGSGARPGPTDTVRVHYRGTFADGREFDSSFSRGQPASFPLNRVIPCWTEGVQRMAVGTRARLTCPAAIAYGSRGAGGGVIPPDTPLQFEVELLAVNP